MRGLIVSHGRLNCETALFLRKDREMATDKDDGNTSVETIKDNTSITTINPK